MMLLADAQMQLNESVEALKYANQAVETDKADWEVYFKRANINFLLERYEEALKDVQSAKKYSKNILPHPFLLEGVIYYQEKKFDQGKKSYEKASQLNPLDANARIGIAEYYSLKKDYHKALLELEKIEKDFPGLPVIKAKQAYLYGKTNQSDKAKTLYSYVLDKWQKYYRMPAPESVYKNACMFAYDQKDDDLILKTSLGYLQYYFEEAYAVEANLGLSKILEKLGNKDVAKSHLWSAYYVDSENKEVEDSLAKYGNVHILGIDGIKRMLQVPAYNPFVSAQMIAVTPLSITAGSLEWQQCIKEFPPHILKAIYQSNLRFSNGMPLISSGPPGTQGQASNIQQSLIGNWRATMPYGMISTTFNPNGTYSSDTITYPNYRVFEEGTYQIREDQLMFKTNTGQTGSFTFQLNNQILFVNYPNVGVVQFIKSN